MSKKVALFFLSFLFFFGIWELSARALPNLLFILPAPSEILCTLWELRSRFCIHTLCTLKEMLGGFFLALAAAFPLAWMMMRYQSSRSLLQPLFIVIQCLPMFTLAPIMVIWFGWSFTAIVIPTALMIFFPLTLNIYQGLRSTPKDLLEFFQTNQASSWQTFFKLRLPWAVPHISAGFRISSAIAGVGAVAGEWAGAQNGLGMLMLESRRNTDLEVTFGALFCLTVISSLLYGVILYFEKIALPPRKWKPSFKGLRVRPVAIKKKRVALPFFIFAILLFVLFGCKKKEEKTTRLLLDWLPNPNHIPLYVGLEKNFFQEEGINLFILKMQDNGGGISYLTSGQADLLVSHMPGTLKACSRGADIKLVGLLIKEPLSGFIYRVDPKIQKPEDLTGFTLGYCLGGPDTSFLDFLLDYGKIKPAGRKNVSVDLISPMGTGSVDFIFGGFWNIEPAQLRSLGVRTDHFPIQEFGVPRYYEMIILANGGTRESSPAFADAFQRALDKSIRFCQTDPDEAFLCYQRHNPDRRSKTLAWEREAWDLTYPLLADNQDIDIHLLGEFKYWMEDKGIISKSFSIEKIIP
ncbi:MAG: ABC transporter permease/substrate-binding protein [Chlamydiales bacterium]|nr:ABC transporter permease/substrate-binding protein [Chlamydiales bacterium]